MLVRVTMYSILTILDLPGMIKTELKIKLKSLLFSKKRNLSTNITKLQQIIMLFIKMHKIKLVRLKTKKIKSQNISLLMEIVYLILEILFLPLEAI